MSLQEIDELVKEIEKKFELAPKRLQKQMTDLEKKEKLLKIYNDNKPVK